MAGFRSPLFILGISAAPVAENGCVRSMLAPWIGGACAPVEEAGQGGCRSMLAFWMGGACAPKAQPAVPTGHGGNRWYRHWLEMEEADRNAIEEEELALIMTIVMPLITRHA